MVLSWLVVAAVALLIVASLAASKTARIQRATAWGLVVLCSMAGWGWLVEQLAVRGRAADLGLRLSWGASALLGIGGVLCLSSLATRPVLMTLVLGGTWLAAVDVLRWGRRFPSVPTPRSRRWSTGAIVALATLSVLVATCILGGASGASLNTNDDHVAYLIFPKKILATGTLIDPFSLRRLQSLAGQSFLQALTLVGASSPMQVAIFDLGLCLVMVIALVLGSASARVPRTLKSLWILPVMFAVSLPNTRANIGSETSGVMAFLALFRTASWDGFKERPIARAALLGMIGAATCTLRQSYLVPVAVFMIAFYLPTAIAALRGGGAARRECVRTISVALGTLLLFLLGWMILSYRSNRTFLFPVLNGNYHTEYGVLSTASRIEDRLRFLWANITHCHPVRSLPFFLFAGMLIAGRKTGGALPALLWASAVGFVALVYALPKSDPANIARYYYGFAVAMVLAVMMAAFSALPRRRSISLRAQTLVPAVFAIVAIIIHVQEVREEIARDYLKQADAIAKARVKDSSLVGRDTNYKTLQKSIPAGAPMLVMLEEPFWLDFRRNPIDIVDLPGSVSPPPGMPLDDNEKLVQYLAAQGYRYLAFVRSTGSQNSLYRRTHGSQSGPDALIWLKTFDRFEGLIKSRASLYDDGKMIALDLATRRSG
jgi:hypothetical protein